MHTEIGTRAHMSMRADSDYGLSGASKISASIENKENYRGAANPQKWLWKSYKELGLSGKD